MSSAFSYSLAASFIVLMLFPVLHQIVNRCTSFRFNRVVIIGGMILSLILPPIISIGFISLPSVEPVGITDIELTIDSTISDITATDHTITNAPEPAIPWIAIAVIVYFSGIAVLLCREAISFARLFSIIAHCDKTKKDGITICRLTDTQTAPFSWGKFIFLHDSEYDNATDSIYLHEKAHTDRRHWIDVLFADMFCIMLWYNPFAWLTRQLMKLNHEFEADESVIRSGVGTHDYQRLLVIKAMGMKAITVANSFAAGKRNFRKRVLTMSRKRSSKKVKLISLCALPAIVFAAIAIASPVSAGLLDSISDFSFVKSYQPEITVPVLKITDDLTPEATESPSIDETELTQRIYNALTDYSEENNLAPKNHTITVVTDAEGNITNISTTEPDNRELKNAIHKALNNDRIEMTQHERGSGAEIQYIFSITPNKEIQKAASTHVASDDAEQSLPEFDGGYAALKSFIIENLQQPEHIAGSNSGSKRTVNVQFTIDTNGDVVNANVINPQDELLDSEAVRVINLTRGKWKPAIKNGSPVQCTFSIPITFSKV